MPTHPLPRTLVLLALTGTFGSWADAAAQDTAWVEVGERVRVSTEAGATHVGLITALTPGAIELERDVDGRPISVPTAWMTRLEVSREHSRAVRGALIGLGVGVVGALALCHTGEDSCVYRHFNGGVNDFTNELPFILGGVGAIAGALIGHREFKAERWEEVSLDGLQPGLVPWQVSLVPGRYGGAALRISFGF
jgi:hypothetical protein